MDGMTGLVPIVHDSVALEMISDKAAGASTVTVIWGVKYLLREPGGTSVAHQFDC